MAETRYHPVVYICMGIVIGLLASYMAVSPVKSERMSIVEHAKFILASYDKVEDVHAKFIGYDSQRRLLQIEIGEFLTLGTDSAGDYAAVLFWRLAQIDDRMVVFVMSTDGYVPSRENPIGYEWAYYLYHDRYPDPEEGIAETAGRIYTDAEVHGYN